MEEKTDRSPEEVIAFRSARMILLVVSLIILIFFASWTLKLHKISMDANKGKVNMSLLLTFTSIAISFLMFTIDKSFDIVMGTAKAIAEM